MYRKTFSLVLLGILLAGVGTIAYGTFFDKGFAASLASVAGGGNADDPERHGKGAHQSGEEDDDD